MPNLTILNVAEKNDAAKRLSQIMSSGNSNRREGFSKFNKIYEFNYDILNNSNCKMIMTSVSGHLMEHEFVQGYQKWNQCRPVALFDAPVNLFVPEKFKDIQRTLHREARKSQVLIIWTDGDREGENIGFEIIKVCQEVKPNIRLHRAKFSEITPRAVNMAAQNLVAPDENVSNAVMIRQELDLRIGAAFTRFQTLRLQKRFPEFLSSQVISYGSCQFPTLGFVVERYQQVQDFIPETFYKIKVVHRKEDVTAEFSWKRGRLFNQRVCAIFCSMCQESPNAKVLNVTSKPKSKWRPLPLDTVELEKTASKKLKINAKVTMDIAEKLYNRGIISYPRTETNIFPKGLNLAALVQNQTQDNQWGDFAQGILQNGGPNPRQGKKTDNAHPPIHPIKFTDNLQGNEKKVYDFIVRHFLACVSKDAQGQETTVEIEIAGEHFSTHGLIIIARNYLEVYIYEGWSAKNIPNYCQGETFVPNSIDMTNGETQAPPLLSESDLIALMEKHGIGTDATHADHIEKIKERQYVGVQNDGTFLPGKLGMGLVEGYDAMGFAMSKPHLRAGLEADLKLICEGRKDKNVVLADQIRNYKEVFEQASIQVEKLDNALSSYFGAMSDITEDEVGSVSEPIRKCPKCGVGDMTLRKTKEGSWLFGCMNYPDCRSSMFFPNFVTNVTKSDSICSRCKPQPVYKLVFIFKKGSVPPMMMSPYTSCIGGCDDMLLGLFSGGSRPSLSSHVTNQPVNNSRNTQGPQNQRNSLPTVTNPRNKPSAKNKKTKDNKSNTSQKAAQPRAKMNQRQSKTSTFDSGPGFTSRNDGGNSSFKKGDDFGGNANFPSNNGNDICCDCGVPAIQLTTRKAGPNQNRPFYKCGSSTHSCNFFLWGDSSNNSIPSGSNNINQQQVPGCGSVDDDVKCKCNILAVTRTVNKDGPNKGRQFYCCMKNFDESCKFFQWTDENGQAGVGSSSNSFRNSSFEGFDNSFAQRGRNSFSAGNNPGTDDVVCKCGNPSVVRTVNKEGANKGRQFHSCSKPMDQSCRFFQWADESISGNSSSATNSFGNKTFSGNNSFAQGRQNSYSTSNMSNSTDVSCNCGTAAVLRMVKKEGANKGRQFYCCPKPREIGCQFFQWSDDNNSNDNNNNNNGIKSRKRKCGQCGESGHDKRSCPQNG